MRLIDDGCAGFGQILRSFSFKRPHSSPHTIEQSDSNRHNLVTITNLGQPPREFSGNGPLSVGAQFSFPYKPIHSLSRFDFTLPND